MAETSNSIPAPSVTPPQQFDPAVWLSHFESSGGGYLSTDNQIRLCIICRNGTPGCRCVAHKLIHGLTDHQRGQVVALIRTRGGVVEPQPDLNAICLDALSNHRPIGHPSSGGALEGQQEGLLKMDMTHAFALPNADVEVNNVWRNLVADYIVGRNSWLATAALDEEASALFDEACALLPPKPAEPSSGLPANMLDMTIREIKVAGDTQENKAAWDDYKRDHEAWKAERDALAEQIMGPAKAAYNQAYSVSCDAFNALATHRVTNLRDLHEKIELVAKEYEGFDIPQEYTADFLTDVAGLMGGAIAPPKTVAVDPFGMPELVGPDLTKAEPIENVIESLASSSADFGAAFFDACRASGIGLSVNREADGIDRLMFGNHCDSQEDIRRARLDELIKHLKQRPDQRQAVVDLVNLSGMFSDGQPFASAQKTAEAFWAVDGRLMVQPDGQLAYGLPMSAENWNAETLNGHPLRRLLQRYETTLRRKGMRDEIIELVLAQGVDRHNNGWIVLEGKEANNA